MKIKNIFYGTFMISILIFSVFIITSKTYSYGIATDIKGSPGARRIIYEDIETGAEISFEDAQKYFGVEAFEETYDNNQTVYFAYGKEVTKNEYLKGLSIHNADERATRYGKSAYRVHTTDEFKHVFDDIFTNLKVGEFHIEFSNYENINLDEVNNYFKSKYGVIDYKQNYYPYKTKGAFEPDRYGLNINLMKQEEELVFNSSNILISGNELYVADDFVNKLLPYIQGNGSEYDKILGAYTYLHETSRYLVDNGFVNDGIAANISIYDAFINRQTTCIGFSIAFSYLMDKFGIESYIVDRIEKNDIVTKEFSSTHTYNIVKFDNKFYKVDLTVGPVFLGTVSASELYDNSKPLASSSYNSSRSINIDYNAINNILNNSRNTKTTTTTKIAGVSTTKTYPYSLPNGYVTSSQTSPTKTNAPSSAKTTIVTSQDASGNIIEIPITVPNENESTSYLATTMASDTTKESTIIEKKGSSKKALNLNFILFPILIIIIGILIFLRVKNKTKLKEFDTESIFNKNIKEKVEK